MICRGRRFVYPWRSRHNPPPRTASRWIAVRGYIIFIGLALLFDSLWQTYIHRYARWNRRACHMSLALVRFFVYIPFALRRLELGIGPGARFRVFDRDVVGAEEDSAASRRSVGVGEGVDPRALFN
jgi:hypothetical protein